MQEIEISDDELLALIDNPDLQDFDQTRLENEDIPQEAEKKPKRERPIVEEETKEKLDPGLYVIGLPIGNLGDLTLRALKVLSNVDLICAEDTRTAVKLLKAYQINPVAVKSFHQHSSFNKLNLILHQIKNEDERVALITEAGTPLISDPGSALVDAAHQLNIPVHVVPGPSAVIAALSGSGFPADRFVFEGFLPRTSAKRKKRLTLLRSLERPIVCKP